MSDDHSDPQLDAQLRDVRPPDGLRAQLRAIAVPSDAALDQRLRDVPLPAGLTRRLREALADEQWDERLRHVRLPASTLARLRVIPLLQRRFLVGRLALAASLMLIVGAAYFGVLASVLWSARPRARPVETLLFVDLGPLQLEAERVERVQLDAGDEALGLLPETADWQQLTSMPDIVPPARAARVRGGAFTQLQDVLGQGMQPWQDVWALRYDYLGYPIHADDDLPELETLDVRPTGGIEPPLVRSYDRSFLFRYGVAPRVVPAAHEQLQHVVVPLVSQTASFDLTRNRASQGRRPDRDEIRVEEFLAAMDYRFPLPSETAVAIRTAAGPSPFGEAGTRLLQIGVQAGDPPTRMQVATHLTLAVDISASMRWRGRLESIQRAVGSLLEHLGSQDRFSLLVFNQEAFALADQADRDQAAAVRQVFRQIRPGGGTNLSAGLQQAVSLAMDAQDAATPRQLVLLTDGRAEMPQPTEAQIRSLVGVAVAQGLTLQVITLDQQDAVSQQLQRLAEAGGVQVNRLQGEHQIYRALVEALTGSSPIVALEAELHVEFNPQTVASYRLLGHEASAMPDGSRVVVPADLVTRQTATALFEVRLKPGDDDNIAWAELRWTDPVSGEPRRARQRVSRLQFAPSFDQSPLSLQAASLAAETAEVLRDSYFARGKSHSLNRVLQQASRVNPRLARRDAFQNFLSLVRQLEHLTPQGGG